MFLREAAPLRAQVVDAIRAHIVDETYPPGARLKEKDLCGAYGVSRTVIREALRQLEAERLVRMEPQVGPVVVTLSASDVRDLYEARGVLEATAGRLAAERASEEQRARLVALYDEIVASPTLTMRDLVELKNRFYRALIEASGNKVLGHMLDNVQARVSQLRRLTLGSPDRHQAMVQELGEVVRAIQARDTDAAYAACVQHVERAARIALRSVAAPEAGTAPGAAAAAAT